MNTDNVVRQAGMIADFAEAHPQFTLAAGAVAVVALLILARLARRHGFRDNALTWAAAAIAVSFSAEGMWEVATGALHLNTFAAAMLFAFGEVFMLHQAKEARKKLKDERDPSQHIQAVWVIALIFGAAASANADNMSGHILRLFLPLAVAWQWVSQIKDELPDVVRQSSRWIWTPQRVGIHLGLLRPGDREDLTGAERDRQVARMVRLADRIDTSGKRLAGRRALRLRRLAQSSDPAVIAEVADRYRRGLEIQRQVFGRTLVRIEDKLSGHADRSADNPADNLQDSVSGQPDSVSAQVNSGADSGLAGLVPVARSIITDLSRQGVRVNRSTLGQELRSKGHRVGGDKLADIWRAVQDPGAPRSVLTPDTVPAAMAEIDARVARHQAAQMNGHAVSK